MGRESPVSEEVTRAFNKALTETLNQQKWVEGWSRQQMIARSQTFKALEDSNHFFYVKAGRATAALLGRDVASETDQEVVKDIKSFIESVRSDWDTQIVVNPDLSLREW